MSERTTLTLEDDVAERLRDEARRTGRSFKDVVNEAIRNGLDRAPEQAAPYRVDSRHMGIREGIDLSDIQGLMDVLDGPDRR